MTDLGLKLKFITIESNWNVKLSVREKKNYNLLKIILQQDSI